MEPRKATRPGALPEDGPADGAVLSFPGGSAGRDFQALSDRLRSALGPDVAIVPAESVTLMRVDLPVSGTRRRLQALPFALEDRLAVPVETLHVALHPGAAGPGALAVILARGVMAGAAAARGRVTAETLAIPAPRPAEAGGTAWAVWREGQRAVIRCSDGTGFAARADSLPMLWSLAGKPALTSLGAALPTSLPAADLSRDPPLPDAADLRLDLRQGAFARGQGAWKGLARAAAVLVGLGLLAHLGIAAADRVALSRIASAETARANEMLDDRAPGLTLDAGLPALMRRLEPSPDAPQRSAFLPLMAETGGALLSDAPQLSVQRLSWDAASGELLLQISAGSLEALQAIETAIGNAGLNVSSGVATAGDGGARADFRIGGPPG